MRSHVVNNVHYAIIFFLSLLFPMPVMAIPAITCHCFTDRSYDPARPASADPYFLATAQNSFIAIVFNIDKKGIVMKKQQGASSDDLWIAYWVASKSGVSPETLLQAKQGKDLWKDVIAPLRLTTKSLGPGFSAALNAKKPSSQLADTLVDEIFLRHKLQGEGDLSALRKAGASSQELIIATVIATRTRQPAKQLYLEVKSGTRSWGSLLQSAKIDTRNMQQEIADILKLHP
jgi:hypothetical protein